MSIVKGGWSGSLFVVRVVRRIEDAYEIAGQRAQYRTLCILRPKEPRQQSADKHAMAQTLRLACPLDPLGYGYPVLICSAGTR